jgi:Skp family chaperone for outer membrane proteins
MEIRVADFGKLSKYYKTYADGRKEINEMRDGYLTKLDPMRKEMETIINSQTSTLIVDPQIQQQRYQRFQQLQSEAMEIDGEFKHKMNEMRQALTKKTYDELQKIIEVWSVKSGIDLVIGKMEVVYLSEKFEITDTILEVIKERELYVEFVEEAEEKEKESV